jgi:hypothetical protein
VRRVPDPWVAITPDGQAVATMVAKQAGLAAQGTSGRVAFHSNDAGRTWDSLPIGLGVVEVPPRR